MKMVRTSPTMRTRQLAPGGSDTSAALLSNVVFFQEPGTFQVQLTALDEDGNTDTRMLTVDVLPSATDDAEILTFNLSFGTQDGTLRLDSNIGIYWEMINAERLTLQVETDDGTPIYAYELPPETVGMENFFVTDLYITEPGNYSLTLQAASAENESDSQTESFEVFPLGPIPFYVEEEWLDEASPVTVCYVESSVDGDDAIQWTLTNDNPTPLDTEPQVRVLFDWRLVTPVGEVIQSAKEQANAGTFLLNTPDGYALWIETYLDIDNGRYSYPVGTLQGAIADNPQFACEE